MALLFRALENFLFFVVFCSLARAQQVSSQSPLIGGKVDQRKVFVLRFLSMYVCIDVCMCMCVICVQRSCSAATDSRD